jgi:hypothetical protein
VGEPPDPLITDVPTCVMGWSLDQFTPSVLVAVRVELMVYGIGLAKVSQYQMR